MGVSNALKHAIFVRIISWNPSLFKVVLPVESTKSNKKWTVLPLMLFIWLLAPNAACNMLGLLLHRSKLEFVIINRL